MPIYKEAVLTLLRAAAGILPDKCFCFNQTDWSEIISYARDQEVLPLLYDGFNVLYEKGYIDADAEVKIKIYSFMQMAEKNYVRYRKALFSLCDYLSEYNIRSMVLKGYALSICYPKPEHRICGDVDIYHFGEWKKADDLLIKNFKIKIDNSHHHHTVYNWNGVMVENHYDFVNIYAHKCSKILDAELKRLAKDPCERIGSIYIPSPTLHALFLIRHSGAHFAGNKIKLRHLLDWYFFNQKYGECVDWDKVNDCVNKIGLQKFACCFNKCAKRLMCGEKDILFDSLTERMWCDILTPNNGIEPHGIKRIPFKATRWWINRWKHKIVYKEYLVDQFFSLLYSHIKQPNIS